MSQQLTQSYKESTIFSLVEYYQGDMFQVLTSGLDTLIGAQRIKRGLQEHPFQPPGIYFLQGPRISLTVYHAEESSGYVTQYAFLWALVFGILFFFWLRMTSLSLLCILYLLLHMLQVWLKREPVDGAARSRKRRTIGSGRRTRKEIMITVITNTYQH